MIVAELELGNVIRQEKVSGNMVSEPFIFDNNLFVLKNGSILKYN